MGYPQSRYAYQVKGNKLFIPGCFSINYRVNDKSRVEYDSRFGVAVFDLDQNKWIFTALGSYNSGNSDGVLTVTFDEVNYLFIAQGIQLGDATYTATNTWVGKYKIENGEVFLVQPLTLLMYPYMNPVLLYQDDEVAYFGGYAGKNYSEGSDVAGCYTFKVDTSLQVSNKTLVSTESAAYWVYPNEYCYIRVIKANPNVGVIVYKVTDSFAPDKVLFETDVNTGFTQSYTTVSVQGDFEYIYGNDYLAELTLDGTGDLSGVYLSNGQVSDRVKLKIPS